MNKGGLEDMQNLGGWGCGKNWKRGDRGVQHIFSRPLKYLYGIALAMVWGCSHIHIYQNFQFLTALPIATDLVKILIGLIELAPSPLGDMWYMKRFYKRRLPKNWKYHQFRPLSESKEDQNKGFWFLCCRMHQFYPTCCGCFSDLFEFSFNFFEMHY